MFIEVMGHHIQITPAIESYVKEKLQRLDKHNNTITTVQVIIKFEKGNASNSHTAEGIVRFKGNNEIFIDVKSDDMYKSIDELIDKLVRKVSEEKKRHQK